MVLLRLRLVRFLLVGVLLLLGLFCPGLAVGENPEPLPFVPQGSLKPIVEANQELSQAQNPSSSSSSSCPECEAKAAGRAGKLAGAAGKTINKMGDTGYLDMFQRMQLTQSMNNLSRSVQDLTRGVKSGAIKAAHVPIIQQQLANTFEANATASPDRDYESGQTELTKETPEDRIEPRKTEIRVEWIVPQSEKKSDVVQSQGTGTPSEKPVAASSESTTASDLAALNKAVPPSKPYKETAASPLNSNSPSGEFFGGILVAKNSPAPLVVEEERADESSFVEYRSEKPAHGSSTSSANTQEEVLESGSGESPALSAGVIAQPVKEKSGEALAPKSRYLTPEDIPLLKIKKNGLWNRVQRAMFPRAIFAGMVDPQEDTDWLGSLFLFLTLLTGGFLGGYLWYRHVPPTPAVAPRRSRKVGIVPPTKLPRQ